MIAYIGIGANLGQARANVEDALLRLAALPATDLLARSSLWKTAPVDAAGDDYINAVACLDTALAPDALLTQLQAIELAHGRERPYRNAPRTLDLDILLYGEQRIDSAALTVPHPRMHERAFVLAPLAEIAPDAVIAGIGAVAALLPALAGQAIERLD
ncbi:2-amino-4-hydroxy-6-hydroxymethyldihydropteridine diphosphokinase [Massilia sp. DWR3-1-1]|uniref:2-amino-4-hydroxy-6- hydroxymethyldihydropteridine diphosphokinase n=1 Tax=Massilia sp. DWR3-1-1 TaxID=2804559 RepID=UPI003CF86FB0